MESNNQKYKNMNRWKKGSETEPKQLRWKNQMSSESHQSKEESTLNLFAEMMIEKIKSFQGDWKKPWFTDGEMEWPKNLSGREYNGGNALMLMMHCERNGYKIPRFATFKAIQALNEPKGKAEREEAQVHINKGEKSFPVFFTTFKVVDKETREQIPYDDFKQLSEEDQKKYAVYPRIQVYNVFNVAQTNLQEARPDLWEKLERKNSNLSDLGVKDDSYSFAPVDSMIKNNGWICPIKPQYGDRAYYSVSKNEIVVPERQQFKDGESFYTNLFHEMGHSTGAAGQLDRLKPTAFGSAEYAREELVAELTAALTAQRYGMTKNIKEDSVAYLKSWLDSLNESPQFIKTTLSDVKKASSMISQRIDQIALEQQERQTESVKQVEVNNDTVQQKPDVVYYASVAYLQSTDDTSMLDELQDKGDYDRLLMEAKEYDQGDAIDLEETYKTATKYPGDDVLVEDANYAVVYNNRVGGTYEVMRKVTEQDVRDTISRYGMPLNATADVEELSKDMEDEQEKVCGVDMNGDGEVETNEMNVERPRFRR